MSASLPSRSSSCSEAMRSQCSSISSIGSPSTSSSGSSRCSDHRRSRVAAREVGIERDDVHLRVVEERVRVQVRRADGEPAVVDDPDLRVDVHRVAEVPRPRVDRAGEEARRLVRGMDERRDLAARDVGAVVRARGQQRRGRGSRRSADSRACRRGSTRSRATRGTGSRGRRSARPSAARRCTTRGSSSRRAAPRDTCRPEASARSAPRRHPPRSGIVRAREELPRRAVPAQPEVLARRPPPPGPSIRTAASCQPIPPRATCDGVSQGSPPSSVRSMPPDERNAAVDHDRLLVMAVRESRAAVRVRLDLRVPGECRRASRGRRSATA